ncbi:MAG TPA: HNH endonuclease signature motif containing protein [Anaeromyxobacteraceae bacterium]
MHDTRDLAQRLAELLRREHGALADFLVALSDFDRERRWVELGYTSCFYFLHRELGLSKGAAFYRKTAAELIQRYPEVIEPLRDGRLCITSVVELAKVITPENRGEVVARFFHASKREAQAVAAELRPREATPLRDVVTTLRPAAPAAAVVRASTSAPCGPAAAAPVAGRPARDLICDQSVHPDEPDARRDLTARAEPAAAACPAVLLPAATRDEVEPLTADLRRLHTTVSRRFLDKLAAARDALSHAQSDASTEAVLEAALDLLLVAQDKKRALVKKPRQTPPKPSASPRHIPAEMKRAVWKRDGARCQWPLVSGGICGSTTRLELDHVVPVARGGASTVDNLRVCCAFHNQLAAREVFGEDWMGRYAAKARRET